MFMLGMLLCFLIIFFCCYMVVYTITKGNNTNKKNAENMVKSYVYVKDNSDDFGVADEAPCINCPECGVKMTPHGNVYICDACGYTLKRDGAKSI